MPYPSAETLSDDEFKEVLAHLNTLLRMLPAQLPFKTLSESQFAQFQNFEPDPEMLEKTGCEVAALGEELEHVFGWKARSSGDGMLPIKERGPGICSLHQAFSKLYINHPDNNVLKKWVVDVANAAESAFFDHNTPAPIRQSDGSQKRARSESVAVVSDGVGSMRSTKAIVPANTSGRGRNTSDIVKKLVTKYSDSGKNSSWECISDCGTVRKGNAQITRILAHASTCNVLKEKFPELYQEAVELSSAQSLSAKLEELTGADSDLTASASRDSTPSGSAPPPAKKLKGQATLDVSQLQGAGKKKKEEARKTFQLKVDHIIMRLICVRGLVPNVIDSSEWKELMETLNPDYHPTSSSTFSHDLIPKEAAYVRGQQIEHLKLQKNLTLTFDGTTIRKPQSLYTVHAITPLREIYFLDGHEGSNAHHTTAWLKDKLISTLSTVGVSRWAAACSDNTNVTKAARREVSAEFKTILTVNDCVHHLHLAIKDITTLSCFKLFISMMQSIIQHFSHSTYSTTLLRQNDGNEKPLKALQTIGKTRFGTYWLAAQSLEPCLQQIQKLVSKGEVKFKNEIVQGMFMNKGTGHYSQFERSLLHYLHIVEPFIRSLWSLEAARANASDVFVFWCAVAAVLKSLFDKGPGITGIPSEHAEKVITVFNKRYKEMFADHLYFTAFTLDPRFALEDFLKQKAPCPVSVTTPITFTIPRVNPQTGLRVRILAHHEAYEITKEFLKDMLRNLLISIEKNPDDNVYPILKEYGAHKAADQLKVQLESFWRKEWPFATECGEDMDPLAWWEKIALLPNADVLAILAIKIFSILVNSMPDERTNSTITWFNSKQRGSQQSRTIVDMIQIGQWHGKHKGTNSKKPGKRPVVKFRALDKDALEALKYRCGEADPEADSIELESESDDDEVEDDAPAALPASIAPGVSVVGFEINPLVDITAPALLDMISDKPTGRPHDEKRKAATSARKLAEVERKESVESVDWQW